MRINNHGIKSSILRTILPVAAAAGIAFSATDASAEEVFTTEQVTALAETLDVKYDKLGIDVTPGDNSVILNFSPDSSGQRVTFDQLDIDNNWVPSIVNPDDVVAKDDTTYQIKGSLDFDQPHKNKWEDASYVRAELLRQDSNGGWVPDLSLNPITYEAHQGTAHSVRAELHNSRDRAMQNEMSGILAKVERDFNVKYGDGAIGFTLLDENSSKISNGFRSIWNLGLERNGELKGPYNSITQNVSFEGVNGEIIASWILEDQPQDDGSVNTDVFTLGRNNGSQYNIADVEVSYDTQSRRGHAQGNLVVGPVVDFERGLVAEIPAEAYASMIESLVLNGAPEFDNIPGYNPRMRIAAGDTVRLDLNATDIDGDALTFALIGMKNPYQMTIDSQSGEIYWPTAEEDIGHSIVNVSVSDGINGAVEREFPITVYRLAVEDQEESNRALSAGLFGRYGLDDGELSWEARVEGGLGMFFVSGAVFDNIGTVDDVRRMEDQVGDYNIVNEETKSSSSKGYIVRAGLNLEGGPITFSPFGSMTQVEDLDVTKTLLETHGSEGLHSEYRVRDGRETNHWKPGVGMNVAMNYGNAVIEGGAEYTHGRGLGFSLGARLGVGK
jgi:hypothetical protein